MMRYLNIKENKRWAILCDYFSCMKIIKLNIATKFLKNIVTSNWQLNHQIFTNLKI